MKSLTLPNYSLNDQITVRKDKEIAELKSMLATAIRIGGLIASDDGSVILNTGRSEYSWKDADTKRLYTHLVQIKNASNDQEGR